MSPLHILHLSPPPFPVPAAFSFYPPVFTYSFHPFYGRIRRGLSPFALLLTWVSVGGASRWRLLLRRQPIWACGVGGGGREKKGWNMNRMTEKTETAPVSATSAKARRFKTNK